MKTIAILSQKGGSGKTTLAISLAVAAQQHGKQTVLIDLDPQATACNWKDRRQAPTPFTTDVQPARLVPALTLARQNGMDLAVIDTPPRLEQAALAAAKAADLVLIPLAPQIKELETIPNTVELLSIAGKRPVLVVLNKVPPRGDRHEQALRAIAGFGLTACPAMLTYRAAFGDADTAGLSALEHDPHGKAAREVLEVYNYICQHVSMSEPRKVAHA